MLLLICSINFISNVYLGLISSLSYNYTEELIKISVQYFPHGDRLLKLTVKSITFKYF